MRRWFTFLAFSLPAMKLNNLSKIESLRVVGHQEIMRPNINGPIQRELKVKIYEDEQGHYQVDPETNQFRYKVKESEEWGKLGVSISRLAFQAPGVS